MTTHKALEYLEYKAKKFRNPKDIEAYNTLVEYVSDTEKAALENQTMFAKMLVKNMMEKAELKTWQMTQILSDTEQTLQTPLITLLEQFQMNVPLFKFETIVHHGTEKLDPIKDYEKIKAVRMHNMLLNQRALTEALQTEWDIDDAVRFLESTVRKFVNYYSDRP